MRHYGHIKENPKDALLYFFQSMQELQRKGCRKQQVFYTLKLLRIVEDIRENFNFVAVATEFGSSNFLILVDPVPCKYNYSYAHA